MDGLKKYMVRVGSLELGVVIFWMLFWLANGLGKVIPGVHIGVKFAEKGGNPFTATLDKMGWGTGLGEFAFYFTAAFELLVGLIFLWALIQFLNAHRPGSASAMDTVGALHQRHHIHRIRLLERRYGDPPGSPILAHRLLRLRWVSWLVIVGQSVWMRASGNGDSN